MNFVKDSYLHKDRILILDFCSQYTQLIARRIRELGVYCEIVAYWNVTKISICEFNPSGIILSGSPESINQSVEDTVFRMQDVFQCNVPVLGICYGMHVMVVHFGGSVRNDLSKREFGSVEVKVVFNSLLVSDIYDSIDDTGSSILNVWMSHSETVVSISKDFIVIGITKNCNIAIIANEKRRLYGVQFHPEVTHTLQGMSILKRFVLKICSCEPLWKTFNIVNHLVAHIRKIVQNDTVMLAFSGGIDSLVTALLLQRAVGNNRLICCFVDSGLLRYNECIDDIERIIRDHSLNVSFVSASDKFFNALSGIKDPEEKRKVIGRVFISIFEKERKCFSNNIKWLAQGTIYPDIIESGMFNFSKDCVIKSHHNVSALFNIETMKLLEPIKNLFKDEVRKIGKELGISTDILYRHPFPGPGLGIRILGEVTRERCDLVRQADNIFIKELQRYNLYTKISQAFSVFLPVRSVGIMGDVRSYEWVVALRAVETTDFMTACWVDLPYNFLCRVSSRIINEVSGISRVVYDISNKPPATIEWE